MIDKYIYWQNKSAGPLLVSSSAPPASQCHPSLALSSVHLFCLYPFTVITHACAHTLAVAYAPPPQHIGLGKLLFERAYLSCLIAYLGAGCVIEPHGLISCKHNRPPLSASEVFFSHTPSPCFRSLIFKHFPCMA